MPPRGYGPDLIQPLVHELEDWRTLKVNDLHCSSFYFRTCNEMFPILAVTPATTTSSCCWDMPHAWLCMYATVVHFSRLCKFFYLFGPKFLRFIHFYWKLHWISVLVKYLLLINQHNLKHSQLPGRRAKYFCVCSSFSDRAYTFLGERCYIIISDWQLCIAKRYWHCLILEVNASVTSEGHKGLWPMPRPQSQLETCPESEMLCVHVVLAPLRNAEMVARTLKPFNCFCSWTQSKRIDDFRTSQSIIFLLGYSVSAQILSTAETWRLCSAGVWWCWGTWSLRPRPDTLTPRFETPQPQILHVLQNRYWSRLANLQNNFEKP